MPGSFDIVHECNYIPLCFSKNILICLAQFNLVFAWWCLTTFASKKSMHPFYQFCLLLPWKSLLPDLSISPWRCYTRQCICKQAGTLWRQTQYRTICTPPTPPSYPSPPFPLPTSKQDGFGKKWKTNCSFVSGRRLDTWANSLCILSLHTPQ